MNGKNIVLLITDLDYGGAETQVYLLAKGLKKRGWTVNVISMMRPVRFMQELSGLEISLYSLDMKRGFPDVRAIPRLLKILNELKPVILLSFLYHAVILGRICGRCMGVPVLSSIRNEFFGGKGRELLIKLSNFIDVVSLTNSKLTADALTKRNVFIKNKMRVIPNILSDKFLKSPRCKKTKNTNQVSWLTIGRLHRQKGYDYLLDAFSQLPSTNKLKIVGAGPELSRMEELISTFEISDRVELLGIRDDIPELIDQCDAFVLASLWEGLPNVIIEAMAIGKPIVATNVSGIPELIEDGRNGILVPPRDANALYQAMIQISRMNRDELLQMGDYSRQICKAQFSEAVVIEKWEQLLDEVIDR